MTSAFGSITLIDVTDAGELTAYPVSNHALSVIYSPDDDDNKNYEPDWENEPLILTPVVYYAGVLKNPGENLTIKWYKKIGSSDKEEISSDTNYSIGDTGILTIKKRELSTTYPQITYILEAIYSDSTTGNQEIIAQGQLTFNLVILAAGRRFLRLKGSNVFTQPATSATPLPESLTIEAESENVIIDKWIFSSEGSETWNSDSSNTTTDFTMSNSNAAVTISYEVMVARNYGELKVIGHDKKNEDLVYSDSIGIYKIADGISDSAFNIVLSNEMQMIPTDSTGAITDSYFNNNAISTDIYVFDGAENVSDGDNITIEAVPEGVEGNFVSNQSDNVENGRRYVISKWTTTGDIASVTFKVYEDKDVKITDSSIPIAQKKMTLAKVKTGTDGKDGTSPTDYRLTTNVTSVKLSYTETYDKYGIIQQSESTYTPALNSIEVKATSQTGNNNRETYSSGYITYSIDGGTDTEYDSNSLQNLSPKKSITFKLYNNNNKEILYDSQTIVIVSDGKTGNIGAAGKDGESALQVVCGNLTDTFTVTKDYHLKQETSISIPIEVYYGTTKLNYDTDWDLDSLPPLFGQNSSITNGIVNYSIPTSATCGSSSQTIGTVSFLIKGIAGSTYENLNSTITYTWNVVVQPDDGKDGTSPYFLQITTPSGYIIENKNGDKTATPQLYNGTTKVISGVTYTWKKWKDSGYSKDPSNAWSVKDGVLTVTPDAVDGSASFECTAAINEEIVSTGYANFIDRSDVFTCTLFSTFGDIIKTGQNITGYVYCRVYKNGQDYNKITLENGEISSYAHKNEIQYKWNYGQYDSNGIYTDVTRKQDTDGEYIYAPQTEVPYITMTNDLIDNKIVITCEAVVTVN